MRKCTIDKYNVMLSNHFMNVPTPYTEACCYNSDGLATGECQTKDCQNKSTDLKLMMEGPEEDQDAYGETMCWKW